jgi:hypothetical protein
MASPRFPRLPQGGRLALLVSLALHAALGLSFWSLSGRGGSERRPALPMVNLVATEDEAPASLSLVEIRPPAPRVRPPARALPVKPPNPIPEASAPKPNPPNKPAVGEAGPTITVPVRPSGSGPGDPVASPGTPAGGTTFFQVAAQGQRIVYVIDRSMSMGLEGRLAAARRELLASLERLPATASFQVIVYNSTPQTLALAGRTALAPATAENKREAALLLKEVFAEGRTNHLPALRQALLLQPDVVFFLTDADDLKDADVREATRINYQQNGGRTAIHTIELTADNRGRPDMPLQVLARDNHGVYRAVSLEEER